MILQLIALLLSLIEAKATYGSKSYSYSYKSYSYSYSSYRPTYYTSYSGTTHVVGGGGSIGGLCVFLFIVAIIFFIICASGARSGVHHDGYVEHHTVTVVENKPRAFPPGWNESMMPPMHPPGFEPGSL